MILYVKFIVYFLGAHSNKRLQYQSGFEKKKIFLNHQISRATIQLHNILQLDENTDVVFTIRITE